MLSVLIPTYNSSCFDLVYFLYKQLEYSNVPFEIIVADDASEEANKTENRKINQLPGARFVEYDCNAGPAVVRNRLAEDAKYPYLLYLDSDVYPAAADFIANYIRHAKPDTVVCGGFTYKREIPEAQYALRYYYGIRVEEKHAEARSLQPYSQFISMNFLIPRDILLKVRFDETFHLGYEDTFFGMQLAKEGISVLHIDNPVYHQYKETTADYLAKIRRAVKNLIGHEEELKPYIRLLQYHNRLNRIGLTSVAYCLFNLFENKIVSNLCGSKPSLNLFAFYKLGCLIRYRSLFVTNK